MKKTILIAVISLSTLFAFAKPIQTNKICRVENSRGMQFFEKVRQEGKFWEEFATKQAMKKCKIASRKLKAYCIPRFPACIVKK